MGTNDEGPVSLLDVARREFLKTPGISIYHIPEPDMRPEPFKECPHPKSTLCKTVCSNGVAQYKLYCDTCGTKVKGPIKYALLSESQRKEAPLVTSEDMYARSMAYFDHEGRVEAARRRWFDWYDGYLASDVWVGKRDVVLDRAGGVCEACGIAAPTQVHHLTYKNVGREPLFDLRAVCKRCHDVLHRRENTNG
jgi:hypothetical protein